MKAKGIFHAEEKYIHRSEARAKSRRFAEQGWDKTRNEVKG